MLPWYSAIEFCYRIAMTFWILSWEYIWEGLRTSACLALVRTWKHVCEGEISHSPHLDPNSPVESPKKVEGSFYVSFSKKEVGPGASQNKLQSTILPLLVCVQTLGPSSGEDATKWAYPLFLPQKKLFSSFCCKRNFSPIFAAWLTFLLCCKTFCCAIKLPAVQ